MEKQKKIEGKRREFNMLRKIINAQEEGEAISRQRDDMTELRNQERILEMNRKKRAGARERHAKQKRERESAK